MKTHWRLELFLQSENDYIAFFEDEGISEEDQAWGEGEIEDYGDYYSLAEQYGGRYLAEIGSNLRNTIVDIGVIILVAFALCYTRDPGCLLGLIFLRV